MKKLLLASLCFLVLEPVAHAEFLVGTGMSSVTKGRTVPSLYAGLDVGSAVYTFYAVGVKTDIYYHSAYRLSYYLKQSLGNKHFGFGLGAHYSIRGYRNDIGEKEESETDLTLGPGFRFSMDLGESFFVSVETLYGLRGLMALVLSFQNTNSLNIGVRF